MCVTVGVVGLSPRVRGNPRCGPRDCHSRRSIPACAGEPPSAGTPNPLQTVYPRVCGGTAAASDAMDGGEGLSPRVRGNLRLACSAFAMRGSIPACAGEPPTPHPDRRLSTVYPRVCGGTRFDGGPIVRGAGLSPRVRGNHSTTALPDATDGSIPACAGEPTADRLLDLPRRVYPRVCGGTVID